eukprot:SAG31_NODE_5649_length_2404_cov_1.374837_2_plen_229_part_00
MTTGLWHGSCRSGLAQCVRGRHLPPPPPPPPPPIVAVAMVPSCILWSAQAGPFAKLQLARQRLVEAVAAREAEAQGRLLVAAQMRQLEQLGVEVFRHCSHIREDILTLKCPRCAAAFIDFDGCMALTCAACGAGFCAWCLKDCGEDAHDHVALCSAKPVSADEFYATSAQYEAAWKKRRQGLLLDYVAAELHGDKAVRQKVEEVLHDELDGLGLTFNAADGEAIRKRN